MNATERKTALKNFASHLGFDLRYLHISNYRLETTLCNGKRVYHVHENHRGYTCDFNPINQKTGQPWQASRPLGFSRTYYSNVEAALASGMWHFFEHMLQRDQMKVPTDVIVALSTLMMESAVNRDDSTRVDDPFNENLTLWARDAHSCMCESSRGPDFDAFDAYAQAYIATTAKLFDEALLEDAQRTPGTIANLEATR